jgi:hypothetical protein
VVGSAAHDPPDIAQVNIENRLFTLYFRLAYLLMIDRE